MRKGKLLLYIGGLLLMNFFIKPLFSDNTCKIISSNADGSYLVEIGDKKLVAVATDRLNEVDLLKKELQKQKSINKELRALIVLDRKAEKEYSQGIGNKTEYIKKLEEGYNKCKTIVKRYEQVLDKQPFLSVSAGLGYVNDDVPVGGIVGIGVHNFRLWGTLSRNTRGVYAGYNFDFK